VISYFVTGTDTGVGKTTVTLSLIAAARQRGMRAACMKPVESGCRLTPDGGLIPEDAVALAGMANAGQGLDEVCLYRYREPLAPGVAAERAGQPIDFDRILTGFADLARRQPDVVFVEGAGGMLVPLCDDRMIIDIAAALRIPVLLVCRPGLGTINHSLLSIEAAHRRDLELRGYVFSAGEGEVSAPAMERNAIEITRASRVPYLGCVPRISAWSEDDLLTASRGLRTDIILGG